MLKDANPPLHIAMSSTTVQTVRQAINSLTRTAQAPCFRFSGSTRGNNLEKIKRRREPLDKLPRQYQDYRGCCRLNGGICQKEFLYVLKVQRKV